MSQWEVFDNRCDKRHSHSAGFCFGAGPFLANIVDAKQFNPAVPLTQYMYVENFMALPQNSGGYILRVMTKQAENASILLEYVLFLPAEKSGGYSQRARGSVNSILLMLYLFHPSRTESWSVGTFKSPSCILNLVAMNVAVYFWHATCMPLRGSLLSFQALQKEILTSSILPRPSVV